jgi:microcin C transport system permease protein
MSAYFIRRLLLVPVTFLAITFIVYAILRIAPGGPIEQAEAAMKLKAAHGEAGAKGGGLSDRADLMLDEQALEDLKRYYALDRPIALGYLQWLGVAPRPYQIRVPGSNLEKEKTAFEPLQKLFERRTKLQESLDELLAPNEYVARSGSVWRPLTDAEVEKLPKEVREPADRLAAAGFGKAAQLEAHLAPHGLTWSGGRPYRKLEATPENQVLLKKAEDLMAGVALAADLQNGSATKHGYDISPDGMIFRVENRFSGILQGDFGRSYTHSRPVLGLITSRFEISLIFGITGYLLAWLVCVPLGTFKAVRHGSLWDSISSFGVLLAYSVPGYVVAMLLLASIAAQGLLPLGGYQPPDIEKMSAFQALAERVRYMIIPVTAYVAGEFALMTMLMKNSVMENLTADYVRTAIAKGLTERRVIFLHVLRNSLIPITAGIGSSIGLMLAGSFLIEKTTNIPGMGLLGFEALLQRDYPVVMGILVFSVVVTLVGNILSDLVWAAIDPRIRFGGQQS